MFCCFLFINASYLCRDCRNVMVSSLLSDSFIFLKCFDLLVCNYVDVATIKLVNDTNTYKRTLTVSQDR